MILNLSDLRHDFKACYKKHQDVAKKIEILIEVTKIEISHQDKVHQAAKRLKISNILSEMSLSLRSLQRWKKNYRENGLVSLFPVTRGHPEKRSLPCKTQELIWAYRENYRWGSEVIKAHLSKDHCIEVSRYKIDRYLRDSGLVAKYPCTTKKKTGVISR